MRITFPSVTTSHYSSAAKVGRHRVFGEARGVETSSQHPHEARAQELEQLGDYRAAARIRICGVPIAGHTWICKRRDCPSCAERTAGRHYRIVNFDVRVMADPIVTIIALLSPPRIHRVSFLGATIQRWRSAFGHLRRLSCMSNVVAGSGGLEVKLTADRRRWNVHAHLVLDVAGGLDLDAIGSEWRRLTDGHGTFVVHPEPRLISSAAQSRYATKATGFCPAPGSMSLDELDELRAGLKGRRLLVRFGGRHVEQNESGPVLVGGARP